MNNISIKISGKKITNWDALSVVKSMQNLVGVFSFRVVVESSDQIKDLFESQDIVEIFVDEIKIMTGYIYELNPVLNVDSVVVSISGAEKTSDLVDCSAVQNTGTWKKIGLLQLVQNICTPYNITVKSDTNLGDIFPKFSIIQGEKAFDAINRACAERSVIPMTDSDGTLFLTNMSTEMVHDHIRYGDNIMSASYLYNIRNRYSGYIYKSQYNKPGDGWSKGSISISAEAYDENITRNRVLEIRSNDAITKTNAQKRINWEAQVRKGKSTSLSVVIPGWYQKNNILWPNNRMAHIVIPPLSLDTELYISEVNYKLENNVRSVVLNLVDPDIYAEKPVKTIKKKAPRKKNTNGWHL